ncbi:MAG TPA: hypothetical protein DIC57_11550 [Sphaerochaeta sp.]|nr:hypothetical protein [Sphaerochaeta sp.]
MRVLLHAYIIALQDERLTPQLVQSVKQLFLCRVPEPPLVAEILVPALLQPPRRAHRVAILLQEHMTGCYPMIQAGMDCMGVIDMAAVGEEGDDGDGGPAPGALEPHHHDVGNSPEQIL